IAYERFNAPEQASSLLERSLEKSDRLKDSMTSAQTRADLGMIHLRAGRYEQALELTEQALQTLGSGTNKKALAIAVGNLGVIHRHLKQWELAQKYSLDALALDEELGDLFGKAEDIQNLAYV